MLVPSLGKEQTPVKQVIKKIDEVEKIKRLYDWEMEVLGYSNKKTEIKTLTEKTRIFYQAEKSLKPTKPTGHRREV